MNEKRELLVSGERPLIQREETTSVHYLNIQQLRALPVRSARGRLMLQTGVLFDPELTIGGLGGKDMGKLLCRTWRRSARGVLPS